MIELYLLENKVSGKSYVGQTSIKNYGNGILISRAKKKHGVDAFIKTILTSTDNKNTANVLERFFVDLYKHEGNCYNIARGGRGGAIHTEETKLTMSLKLKGRPSKLKGRTLSVEHKLKISASGIGKKHTEEHKLYMSAIMKNREMSEETRAKMSKSAKARCAAQKLAKGVL